jgi:NitT/TauT family transport system permease protein
MVSRVLKPKAEISQRAYVGLGVSAFAVVLAFWSLLTYGGLVPSLFLPTPTDVLKACYRLFREFNLVNDIAVSTYRVTVGWAVAALVGVPLGVLMGTLRVVEAFVEPLIGAFRYMPASAFIPLLILWVGIGDAEKISVIFIGTFFQLVLLVADQTKNISTDLVNTAYTLGAKGWSIFTRVIVPGVLPGIVDTLRVTLGWAWTYLVVAELVAASSGLGHMIMEAQRFLRTPNIIVGILIIGLLGLGTDAAFKWVYKRLFPWL